MSTSVTLQLNFETGSLADCLDWLASESYQLGPHAWVMNTVDWVNSPYLLCEFPYFLCPVLKIGLKLRCFEIMFFFSLSV